MKNAALILAFSCSILLAGWLAGCSESTSPEPGPGILRLNLVDAPASYDSVNVVVARVEVHRSGEEAGSGWTVVRSDTTTFNLLELTNGASAVLTETPLTPGHYTQIRLYLAEGSHVVVGGERHDLRIPSGLQSGLKLNHPFTIAPDQLYEATLDFDADRSIHQDGNQQYVLNPVIRVQWQVTSGSISGIVHPATATAEVWTVAGPDTIATFADALTGFFKLMALPEGVYDVTISPGAGAYSDSVLTGVGVVAGQDTDLGTIELSSP